MASHRQQSLIHAPVEKVWELVGDPRTYPEWASSVVDVTGLPELAEGACFKQTGKTPMGTTITTDFVLEELEDLREIRMRCTATGHYSHWLLTEADDDTFLEVEVGMEPVKLGHKAFDKTLGKRWYRKSVGEMLDELRAKLQ